MGTCFFTLFPVLYGSDQMFRVGASVISGVGFLCSGVIFKDKGSVTGMNTAATLWCTSAIGILSATDLWMLAIIATAILVTSNLILRPLCRKITPISMRDDEEEIKYKISITCNEDAELEIRELLIKSNNSKTLYLTNIDSGDVIGDKVEVIAEYVTKGKPQNHILEKIVTKALANEKVINAGREII